MIVGMTEIVIRFVFGGLIVSFFALIGDVLRPKSFAGLFGAAPSVALVTLTLTLRSEGPAYAALEARSMIAGAFAFCIYALSCMYLMAKAHQRAKTTTLSLLLVWGICAFGSYYLVLR